VHRDGLHGEPPFGQGSTLTRARSPRENLFAARLLDASVSSLGLGRELEVWLAVGEPDQEGVELARVKVQSKGLAGLYLAAEQDCGSSVSGSPRSCRFTGRGGIEVEDGAGSLA
jgi:hypothetical protein